MNLLRFTRGATLAAAAALALCAAQPAPAQLSVGVNIGAAPVCPYGYYGYAPYNCAPYGYYGPEWFGNGVFIGAGPWYHGHSDFYGHVNRRYDSRYGYRGPFPGHEEHFDNHHDFHEFHGGEMMSHRGEYRGGRHGDHH